VTRALQMRQAAFAVAYRMTGRVADAEDIAQDSLVRWYREPRDAVRSPVSYVARIAANLSIDLLKRTRRLDGGRRRDQLPEPVADDPTLVDEPVDFTFSLLVALQELTPLERAVFLLRAAFDCSYDEIGTTLHRTGPACRQVFHRAQRVIREGRGATPSEISDALLQRLVSAIEHADLEELKTLLADNVIVRADGGSRGPALKRPLIGRDGAARFLIASTALLPQGFRNTFRRVGRELAAIVRIGERPVLAIFVATQGPHISRVFAIADAHKIARL
jgi:RNA polymerase sigma-70 factor (ECF subfamily)